MRHKELREKVAILVAGRMAMHWPLQCPICPDRAAMALDITESLFAGGFIDERDAS